MKFLRTPLLLLLLTVSAIAGELRVATLNCYLLFDPAIQHRGSVDDENRMSTEAYRTKLDNLAKMAAGFQVIGLQETGGKDEIAALASRMGYQWAFAKGRDTYTGQEVGLLYQAPPGWRFTNNGRVGVLDRVVSKHLLVTATDGRHRVLFLVVHLLRPIGENAAKQAEQVAAISRWANGQAKAEGTTVVVLGDTNVSAKKPVFSFGVELNAIGGYPPTHLNGDSYDRMTAGPNARWLAPEVVRPPYGKKPNNHLKQVWTDHFLLGAKLVF